MSSIIVLEWNFTPPDYFEEPTEILTNGCSMNIADGKVETKIASSIFESNPFIREELHEKLNCRFLMMQLCTHRSYSLSESTTTTVHSDGRRVLSDKLGSACFKILGKSIDFQITNEDGNAILDTKRDRIERNKRLAELCSTHYPSDVTLRKMLLSYNAGVDDPNNELVHLYEIRDALAAKFGDESSARIKLSIPKSQWSHLGKLCNNGVPSAELPKSKKV